MRDEALYFFITWRWGRVKRSARRGIAVTNSWVVRPFW